MMKWKSKWFSLLFCIVIVSHFILHAHCANIKHSKLKPTPKNEATRASNNKATRASNTHAPRDSNTHAPRTSNNIATGGATDVKLSITKEYVMLYNGIVNLTFSNPSGSLDGIQYNGLDKILEPTLKDGRKSYYDIVWSKTGEARDNLFDTLEATTFKVIGQGNDKIEISFSKTWNPRTEPKGMPLNYDKRFILLRGSSGFYSYEILEHLAGWPPIHLEEARIAFKLNQKVFSYMVISDDKQRIMPDEDDFGSGKTLGYKEAKIIVNPGNPTLKGQVEDKYEYSVDNKDNYVHGWVSNESPRTGFWVITPSDEFRSGGPMKTDLTSHAGPTALAIFFSSHYAGPDLGIDLINGEPWKKVYGPVFIYLNKAQTDDPNVLWNDAKRQMVDETKKWPYDFPLSPEFPHAGQRGKLTGRLMVYDRYINNASLPANAAYIGLAIPGEVGTWQKDSKGYQFWARTDANGYFSIHNIRTGIYNFFAWVPGVIGDYKYDPIVEIKQGSNINLGLVVYNPPRSGPTIWDIGIPDRTAAEFFIPDPSPGLANSLSKNHREKYRQYGLWDRYTDLYPKQDLVYTIGQSHYQKDWFFAHVNRRVGDGKYVPTTWQIKFPIVNVNKVKGLYILRIALASSTYAQLEVMVNNVNDLRAMFKTRGLASGRDNAIARHGIHGLYSLYEINIPSYKLVDGLNTIYIKLASSGSPYNGVMYDYIRLEGPPQ